MEGTVLSKLIARELVQTNKMYLLKSTSFLIELLPVKIKNSQKCFNISTGEFHLEKYYSKYL